MPITALPIAPNRQDPATFSSRADAWVGALDTFTTEANALQTDVNARQVTASNAATTATNAVQAINSALNRYTFSTTTTMADPGVGVIRFNNTTASSATAIAIDAQSADTGNPNILNLLLSFGDSTNNPKGLIRFTQAGTPANYRAYNVTAVTNNTGWVQFTVTHVASAGSFSNGVGLVMEFHRAGDAGDVQLSANNTFTGNNTFSNALTLGTAGTTTTHAVRADRTITAGNGLTGGGDLTANRTFTLGTPDTLTGSTTNAVTATSHTHALSGVLTNTGPQTITSNTGDALTITQTGAGNALVVEDSTNPDSTPFVINAGGFQINGYTTTVNNYNFEAFETTAKIQLHGTTIGTAMQTNFNWGTTSSSPASLVLAKSKGGTIGTRGAVASGDTLGAISGAGDDGTNFITAANIIVEVDGTPGTNDMPGRLVFSTTADGASTPTERMRIDSAGRLTIGSTQDVGSSVYLVRNLTGATSANGVFLNSIAATDVTFEAFGFRSRIGTAAGGAGITNVYYYQASQATLSTAVTNQFGYFVNNTLTGATNNYGFYSNIAAGTGRWNFYANGTAPNYFAGPIRVGANNADLTSGLNNIQVSSGTPGIYLEETDAANDTYLVQNNNSFQIQKCDNGTPLSTAFEINMTYETVSSIYGFTIGRTAVTSPAASDGNVFSGTYTPTLTNVTNVSSSTADSCQYMRVGNVVTVSGQVTIAPTATGNTLLGMSLPITSSLTSTAQVSGTAISQTTTQVAAIYADTTNNRATIRLQAAATTSLVYSFQFTYRVA